MEIQTYVKRSCTKQQGSFDKLLKPHKELKARIDSHVSSPSNGSPSEEVSTPVGQTVDTTKAGSKGSKALVKAANDFALTTTPTAVKRRCKNPELSAPVVLGLRCKAMTVPKNKNSKQLVAASVVGEPGPSQSGVPLVSKTTDKQVNQVVETDGETSATRRWEPAFKRDANRKTLLPSKLKIYDVNEDASVNKSPDRMGLELALRQVESNKPVKGKRGRGRRISLNMEPSPQDLQASRAQEDNGNSENFVEKSLNMEPDDQPINILVQASQEPAGKERRLEFPPSVTKNKDQNSCSEKKSAFWKSIETMEAFRLFPQNLHFRPLNNLNASAREGSAIHKMINFSTVFEDTCRLRQNDPRTKIEEKLEILLELETHGFDVGLLRSRLREMLSLKDKAETHRTDVKEPRDNIASERAKIQERNRLITIIDRHSDELCEKPVLLERKAAELRARREQLMRENEESELKIDSWEELVDDHERAIGECDRRIKELATAPF